MAEEEKTVIQETLSAWNKLKAGTSGFIKKSLEYLPRGIIFVGMMYAGSALISSVVPGADLLGIASLDGAGVATRMLGTMALGALISGGIGAWSGVNEANALHKAEYALNHKDCDREPHREKQLQRQPEYEVVTPQVDIPRGKLAEYGLHPS